MRFDILRRYAVLSAVMCGVLVGACTNDNIDVGTVAADEGSSAVPSESVSQMVTVKFSPAATEVIESVTKTRSGVATRSGMVSVDEVLDAIEGCRLERVFPVDAANEERTRRAGLHQWYAVHFDSEVSVEEAAARFSRLGEVQSAAPNRIIQHAYKGRKAKPLSAEAASRMAVSTRADGGYRYDDPMLQYQWHLINRGDMFITETGKVKSVAGADVQCEKAWERSEGDPSIIVAILDEGVCIDHEDLKHNLWTNEGEVYGSRLDNDGNGYCGDLHGYDFVNNTGIISWDRNGDSGHATHVAGVIAARNGTGVGISSIAGGTASHPGVKIMSCQIFSNGSTSVLELVRAVKYATDNGAVIVQCSFGYTSGAANEYTWGVQGFHSEEEWTSPLYGSPLEKDALDYFTHNAGSPNGPIDGGIAIFAAGNESAPMAGFPGAAADYVSVAATAADFTPAVYTNYGEFTNISAPGGDQDYYYEYLGTNYDDNDKPDNYGEIGCILSTLPLEISSSGYGYMEGTSMACPHVSGVAALGLSYAMQLRKHFTADEFRELLYKTVTPIEDRYLTGNKQYYRYVGDVGKNQMMQMPLSNYRGKMGVGQVNAARLLEAIGSDEYGRAIEFPNLYVACGGEVTVVPAAYFKNGESLTYTVTVDDASTAAAAMDAEGRKMTVRGLKEGATKASVKASDGTVQSFVITVRNGAADKGWL